MNRFKTGAPGWWYGAPLIGVLFGFVANGFFPDVVASSAALIYRLSGNGQPPAAVEPASARLLAPLVGTLLAVLALAAVALVKRLTRIHNRSFSSRP